MTEEVRFFRRVAIYAFVVGAIYWFVSYEPAGTVLLLLFGVATGAGTLLLWWGARGRERAERDRMAREGDQRQERADGRGAGAEGVEADRRTEPDGPFGDESGRVPAPTLGPFLVGLAVALTALGLVYGAWFILAGLIPLAVGAGSWLGAVRGELAGVEADEGEAMQGRAGKDAAATAGVRVPEAAERGSPGI